MLIKRKDYYPFNIIATRYTFVKKYYVFLLPYVQQWLYQFIGNTTLRTVNMLAYVPPFLPDVPKCI